MSFSLPEFWLDLGLTLVRAVLGFLVALGLGLGAGLWAGRPKASHQGVSFAMLTLQATPAIIWSIPFILVFGSGGGAPAAVSFIVTLPLIYFQAYSTRHAIPQALTDVFKVYAPSLRLRFAEMYRPALSSSLRPAMMVGFALAVKSSLIGEWFGARNGLGRRIQTSYALFDMPSFYADSLAFVCFILLLGVVMKGLSDGWFPEKKPLAKIEDSKFSCSDSSPTITKTGGTFRLENVTFSYGDKKILESMDLEISPGEILLVTGDSGTGKTTLAKIISGLVLPQEGLVNVDSRAVIVFQDDGLLSHRDALGNTALPLWESKDPEWRIKALEALDLVGLCEPGIFPDAMSGGMRKRLALARALVTEPRLLILDEPFVNLHASAREELWDLVFRLQGELGFSLVVISHYPDEISHCATRIYKLGG